MLLQYQLAVAGPNGVEIYCLENKDSETLKVVSYILYWHFLLQVCTDSIYCRPMDAFMFRIILTYLISIIKN